MKSMESKILSKMREPFAEGFYEERNAPQIKKFSKAVFRYFEALDSAKLKECTGILFPEGQVNAWQLCEAPLSLTHSYSFTLAFNPNLFEGKMTNCLTSPEDKETANNIKMDLQNAGLNPLSRKYCVGGQGYTHSILNYGKLLQQGLPGYEKEIEAGLKKNPDQRDFYEAMQETLDGIMLFLNKVIDVQAEGRLKDALQAVSARAPQGFYEAMVLFNFTAFLDQFDSFGDLDVYLSSFFRQDIDSGNITEAEVIELLQVFYKNVDLNGGWHMILGSKGADQRFTELCLEAIETRRPNTGLKISPETADAVWEQAFDAMARHTANPAFYNDSAYRKSAVEYAGIEEADLNKIAYGGCTEFMVSGKSNVGSIDSGLNILEILDGAMNRLSTSPDYPSFVAEFKQDILSETLRCIEETQLNQKYKAMYRPQVLRSLFIDNCLESGVEYNAGGAKYNGGVINVAGIANVANSLYAIKQSYEGKIDLTPDEMLNLLTTDYANADNKREMLLSLPKYGNNNPDVDGIANEISDLVFSEILNKPCWRAKGFYIPSVIMFVTYVAEGVNIGATPDGRKATSPVADSCGPMQGTDLEGPTSMLNSTACLPHHKGLGTTILNMRINAAMLKDADQREKLKNLIKSYFEMGGLQVQISVLDVETLKKAEKNPEQFENLVIRIGGYTEYFNRLDHKLQQEVIKRTEFESL